MSHHLKHLMVRYSAFEASGHGLQRAFDWLEAAFQNDQKLLLCGNGGSAADCEQLKEAFTAHRQ